MQFKMYRDKSVHKSGLLKKFLNDLNNIDCPKHAVKPRCSLKYEKPKSFALLTRPKHCNKTFIKQQDGNLSYPKRSEPADSLHCPKSNIFKPEINIDGVMESEEMLSKISFQDILTSTRMEEEPQNLHGANFEQAEKARHTYKQCIPKVLHDPDEVVQRKTIYDYATDCTIIDINVEEQYTKLMQNVNTNILEILDPNQFQTNKRCDNLLERINQSRKFDLFKRCTRAEATEFEVRTPRNSVTTPTLFNETPSTQMTTTFFNKQQSTFFELERTTGREEFLWVKPKAVGKKPAAKQIAPPKQQQHPGRNETFFEKPDNDEEFLKFFSMK